MVMRSHGAELPDASPVVGIPYGHRPSERLSVWLETGQHVTRATWWTLDGDGRSDVSEAIPWLR